ncbi:MAG TPA: VWA domain-containing protein [Steroidobacteraceae bacterium]|jgi:Ca-activated chloride channel family protein|nr:VWA domain-containing protein [Steroidobacteraceae bacterium]
MMFHLAWPWMALLLPLPWILLRLRRVAQPGGSALYLPFAASVATAATTTARPPYVLALLIAAWTLLVLAAMRPQWLGQPLPAPTHGREIMLAVDCSGSMATQDMGGASRLEIAQIVAGRFIDQRRGDQIGLILFGTRPYLQAPLTADIATVHQFLDQAVVGVAGPETAIGDAIGLAIKELRQRERTRGAPVRESVLILLTDGGNDAGVIPPLEAARFAAQTRLRIFTIGVGAAAQQTLFGLSSGNTELDVALLQKIVSITGGEYFRATNPQALQAVYRRINQLEPTVGRDQWLRPAAEWFNWPLALALLLSVPAAWLMAERI